MPSIWLSRGSLLIWIDETFEVVQGKVHHMDILLRQRFFIFTLVFYKKKEMDQKCIIYYMTKIKILADCSISAMQFLQCVLILRSSEDLKDSSTF